jgi:hypothetical protein
MQGILCALVIINGVSCIGTSLAAAAAAEGGSSSRRGQQQQQKGAAKGDSSSRRGQLSNGYSNVVKQGGTKTARVLLTSSQALPD